MSTFIPRRHINGITYKFCPRCNSYVPEHDFDHNYQHPDWRQGYCIQCKQIYNAEYRAGLHRKEVK